MRIVVIVVITLAVVASASTVWVLFTTAGQDAALHRILPAAIATPELAVADDSLGALVCGSSSPLVDPERAQACIAVFAGPRLFIVDAGAGSNSVVQRVGLPMARLEGVLLTHFHSDHIAALPDLALTAWIAGHQGPVQVFGPEGVERVVAGFNAAYGPDRSYRTEHHGADLLPAEGGRLGARPVRPGVILESGGLKITAFATNHAPASPALGYRFDFAGRSLVVSGDTNVAPGTLRAAAGADLLLHDALSADLVIPMAAAAAVSRPRIARVLRDVLDYHAHTEAVVQLARTAGVGQLVLYHLVPPPRNFLLEQVFRRGLPRDVVLARDGMLFELPAGGGAVITSRVL
jgi:ribonuclease Z